MCSRSHEDAEQSGGSNNRKGSYKKILGVFF